MTNVLRVLGHVLRGRTSLWQCYTSVTWRTCEACLAWHGRIVGHPVAFPSPDGCPRELRRFPVWRLGAYRSMSRRMRDRAADELRRRKLFRQARDLLSVDAETSLNLFDQAAAIDVYLPEIRALREDPALADSALRTRMREVHLARWKSKFATERYERQPELARAQQEQWGVQQIKEIFT